MFNNLADIDSKSIKKITFATIEQAVEHAKLYGGWIFKADKKDEAEWFSIHFYTQSDILRETRGSGKIGTWSHFETNRPFEEEQALNRCNRKAIKIPKKTFIAI